MDKLIDLLMVEKHAAASNYVLVVLSEGASWEGYTVQEYGEPDAYGHRKKASIGEALSTEINRRTGEESIVSDLTYDLRSGEPDFTDKLIAATFGNLALDAVLAGKSGGDGRPRRGMLQSRTSSRSYVGAAQSGRLHDVQHRALSSELWDQARLADFPDQSLRWAFWRSSGGNHPSTPPRFAHFSTRLPPTRNTIRQRSTRGSFMSS